MPQDTIEQTLARLQQLGYRVTRPRRSVVRALAEADDWLSPEAIHARARRHCPSLGLVTVYRTLALLLELGYARRVHLEDGCHGYARAALAHTHYLICRSCRQVVEFPGCNLSALLEEVSSQTGFVVERHILELLGTCPACHGRAPA